MAFFSPLGALGSFGTGVMQGLDASDQSSMLNIQKQLAQADLQGQMAAARAFADPNYQSFYGGAGGLGGLGSGMGGGPQPQPRQVPGVGMDAIGMGGPDLEGPARGSPAGPVQQARDANPLALARERIAVELQNNPQVAQRFDALTTAEVGQDPAARQRFQEATINRALAQNRTLAETMTGAYYPPETYGRMQQQGPSGAGVSPGVMEGSNAANFATGNASGTVGFAGGPQTAAAGGERFGIEGPTMPWARAMGYGGPGGQPGMGGGGQMQAGVGGPEGFMS